MIDTHTINCYILILNELVVIYTCSFTIWMTKVIVDSNT